MNLKGNVLNITFTRVQSIEQVENVARLANTIWTEHYTAIIGQDQVNYMLNNFQSTKAISEQINDASNFYYLIINNQVAVGYIAMRLEKQSLFLSKFYPLPIKVLYSVVSPDTKARHCMMTMASPYQIQ